MEGGCEVAPKIGGPCNRKVCCEIATRTSRGSEGAVPIEIRAELLRDGFGHVPAAQGHEFGLLAHGRAPDPVTDCGRALRGRWRQSDVERAICAAQQAGLNGYRVEIAPQGTISIVVGAPAEVSPPSASFTDLLRP